MTMITQDSDIRDLLAHNRCIAVVGLSSNPARPSHGVARSLQEFGYRIVPVNPNEDAVLGENAFPDLSHVPGLIDLVDVFRAPEYVPEIVDACIEKRIRAVLLQEGVIHEAAARKAADAGIKVVMDRCIYKEYKRLLG